MTDAGRLSPRGIAARPAAIMATTLASVAALWLASS